MITDQMVEKFEAVLPANRQRLPLAILWQAFGISFPAEVTSGRSRDLLFELLQALEKRGYTLPASRALYDTVGRPALPQWVQRPRSAPVATEGSRLWAQELAFLGEATHLPCRSQWVLLDVWIKRQRGRTPERIPLRERSFEIFGDEKALDAFCQSIYFRRGMISIEILHCFPVYERLASAPGPEGTWGKPCLVVENAATDHTMIRWNTMTGRYSCVIFGGGNRFSTSWEGLIPLREEFGFSQVAYFGDIDAAGLEIPFRVFQKAQVEGFEMALEEELYRALLDKVSSLPLPPGKGRVALDSSLVEWLPRSIRDEIHTIVKEGRRAPQEALTLSDIHHF